jgi:hypothetical protein
LKERKKKMEEYSKNRKKQKIREGIKTREKYCASIS